jgi:hypothetical protein
MALACFGLEKRTEARGGCLPPGHVCQHDAQCCSGVCVFDFPGKRTVCRG